MADTVAVNFLINATKSGVTLNGNLPFLETIVGGNFRHSQLKITQSPGSPLTVGPAGVQVCVVRNVDPSASVNVYNSNGIITTLLPKGYFIVCRPTTDVQLAVLSGSALVEAWVVG